jgi:hypothetical protein
MKKHIFFQYTVALAVTLVAAANALNAQKPVETRTDERYGNTTIVYKDANTNDAAMLQRLNQGDYGMGDVIRITEAPPKPAVAPAVAAKTPATPVSVAPRNAATAPKVVAAAPKTAPVASKVVTTSALTKKAPAVAAKPVAAKAAPKAVATTPEPAIAEVIKPATGLVASTDNPDLLMQTLTTAVPTNTENASRVEDKPATTTTAKKGAAPAKAPVAAKTTTTAKSKSFYKHKSAKKGLNLGGFFKNLKPKRSQYKCYKF